MRTCLFGKPDNRLRASCIFSFVFRGFPAMLFSPSLIRRAPYYIHGCPNDNYNRHQHSSQQYVEYNPSQYFDNTHLSPPSRSLAHAARISPLALSISRGYFTAKLFLPLASISLWQPVQIGITSLSAHFVPIPPVVGWCGTDGGACPQAAQGSSRTIWSVVSSRSRRGLGSIMWHFRPHAPVEFTTRIFFVNTTHALIGFFFMVSDSNRSVQPDVMTVFR